MTFVVDGTVAALVAILVQVLFKPLLEVWLQPTDPNHDTVVRAMALLLGVLLLAVNTLVGGPWPVNGNAWLLLVGSGAMSGAAAVGAYHLFTGSATPPVPPAVPPPAPTQHVVTLQIAPPPAAPTAKVIDVATIAPPAGSPPQSPSPEPAAPAATPATP